MILRGWMRHRWWSRTIIDDFGVVHRCECPLLTRLWKLVTCR